MNTRKLRDIEVSEVGMGCMAFSHGYGKIPPEQYSIEAIRGAFEERFMFGVCFTMSGLMTNVVLPLPVLRH